MNPLSSESLPDRLVKKWPIFREGRPLSSSGLCKDWRLPKSLGSCHAWKTASETPKIFASARENFIGNS